MLCPAWEPESLSPPPPLLLLLLLHLLWWSDSTCFAQSGGDWDGGRFYGSSLKRSSKWGEREERITAECCRCLWRQRRIDVENALAYFQFCCWSFFHPVRDGHAGLRRIRVCARLSVPQYPKPHAQVQEVSNSKVQSVFEMHLIVNFSSMHVYFSSFDLVTFHQHVIFRWKRLTVRLLQWFSALKASFYCHTHISPTTDDAWTKSPPYMLSFPIICHLDEWHNAEEIDKCCSF